MGSVPEARRLITIRPAVPADLTGIADVYQQSGRYHVLLDPEFYREPEIADVTAHYAARLGSLGDEEQIFVAVDGSHVLGLVEVEFLPAPRSGSMIGPTRAVDIGIAVREEERGAGIGARLMAAAEDWARERGAEFATLDMSARNERAAAFYRRLGYEVSGSFLRKKLPKR